VPFVIEISAKQHRSHFYWTPCTYAETELYYARRSEKLLFNNEWIFGTLECQNEWYDILDLSVSLLHSRLWIHL